MEYRRTGLDGIKRIDHRSQRSVARLAGSLLLLLRALQFFIARSTPMLDVILAAAAFGFFALSVGYTIACDRL